MPRAGKVCSAPGCPEIVPKGTSRCEGHERQADRARGTAAQRGYDSRWRRVRAAHLRREPLCREPGCGAPATDVDHIDGRGPTGPRGYDHTNLRSYCHAHHSQRTARDQPGGWHAR